MQISRFFSITPAGSVEGSAVSYAPLVIFSRGLSFVRVLVVAKLLGDAGQREFGVYQPALEFINWLVPMVMLGMGDVAERYAARYQREGRLGALLKRQVFRLGGVGVVVAGVIVAASPYLAGAIFKLPVRAGESDGVRVIAACAVTIVLLALYQYLAAVLRGITAYAAAAAMETISAVLFLGLSGLAAWRGGAFDLIAMYALSVLLPTIYFGTMLVSHLREQPAAVETGMATARPPRLTRFAMFTLIRLLLVMTFGFLAIWGVTHLAVEDPRAQTAAYAMPYRIAQLLGYVAVTLWASTYGLAAKAWSHGQTRRAKVQLFRIGKFGAVLLTIGALVLLLGRGLFAAVLPAGYSTAINELLPPMLALFTWYGLLAFASTYADLQEMPHKGGMLWGAAVVLQLVFVMMPLPQLSAQQHVLYGSSLGIGAALLMLAPMLLWRPWRLTATAVPLAVLGAAPVAFFSPAWVVDYIAPPVLLAALAFLVISGLLVRPVDRRSWRRLVRRVR
jgi:O-antigen/teichoic acid export membrane protein